MHGRASSLITKGRGRGQGMAAGGRLPTETPVHCLLSWGLCPGGVRECDQEPSRQWRGLPGGLRCWVQCHATRLAP